MTRVARVRLPFSASGKDVPALSPSTTVGTPGPGCVTADVQSPAWPED